nr:hypothetical protein [Holophaga foetida]
MTLYGFTDAFRQDDGIFPAGLPGQYQEFFAPVSDDGIGTAGGGLQDFAELQQYCVPGLMAIVVVDPFEVVDIDHQEQQVHVLTRLRFLPAHALHLRHVPCDDRVQEAPVLQPSHGIRQGLLLQVQIGALKLLGQ